MYRKILRLLLASMGLAFMCGLAYNHWRDGQPVFIFGAGAAHADPAGPSQAIAQAHTLLDLYRKCNGNAGCIGLQNLRLPDQGSAENPDARESTTSAWSFPGDNPIFKDVAFWTDLYARRNRTYYNNDKMNSHPAGLFIVAMKNGDVKQIPVSDIRLMPYQGAQYMVFPGVIGYDSSLPVAPSYKELKQH